MDNIIAMFIQMSPLSLIDRFNFGLHGSKGSVVRRHLNGSMEFALDYFNFYTNFITRPFKI